VTGVEDFSTLFRKQPKILVEDYLESHWLGTEVCLNINLEALTSRFSTHKNI
jgi:hypothetical protein